MIPSLSEPGSAYPFQILKNTCLISALFFAAMDTALAQGQINLISNGAANPVYDTCSSDPGGVIFPGPNFIKLGQGYTFEIWYAPGANKPIQELTPLVRGDFVKNGVFLKSGSVDIPGVMGGEAVTLQVRGWKNSPYVNSWADLFTANGSLVPMGSSQIITKAAGGFDAQGNVVLPLSLVGAIPSWGLACIPEPSTSLLALISLASLVAARSHPRRVGR